MNFFERTKKFIVEVKFIDVSGFVIEENSLSFAMFKNTVKERLYRAVIGGRDSHEATVVIPIQVTEEMESAKPEEKKIEEPIKPAVPQPEILMEKK